MPMNMEDIMADAVMHITAWSLRRAADTHGKAMIKYFMNYNSIDESKKALMIAGATFIVKYLEAIGAGDAGKFSPEDAEQALYDFMVSHIQKRIGGQDEQAEKQAANASRN